MMKRIKLFFCLLVLAYKMEVNWRGVPRRFTMVWVVRTKGKMAQNMRDSVYGAGRGYGMTDAIRRIPDYLFLSRYFFPIYFWL